MNRWHDITWTSLLDQIPLKRNRHNHWSLTNSTRNTIRGHLTPLRGDLESHSFRIVHIRIDRVYYVQTVLYPGTCSLFCKECAIIILGFVEVRLNITVNYRHKHTQLSWDATSKHLGSTVRHFMLWNPAFKNSRQPDGHFYGLFL